MGRIFQICKRQFKGRRLKVLLFLDIKLTLYEAGFKAYKGRLNDVHYMKSDSSI